jgi:hypothetical protein
MAPYPKVHQRKMALIGLAAGAVYGLLARLVFGVQWSTGPREPLEFMAVSFLYLVPFVLGFITVFVGEKGGRWEWWQWVILPWIAGLTALAGALALAWEGIICIVLWLPLVLVLSSLGGIAAGITGRFLPSRRRGDGLVLACCAVLPFVVAPLESRIEAPVEMHTVENRIEIAADPATVWRQIERVPAIREEEQSDALSHWIGFPHPVEAELIGTGVGAVRHATFERGVLFVETITKWEPEKDLAFTIKADTAHIPPTTLDQHVTIGGPYFDVLEGEYRIEPSGPGKVILHLSSQHRLSTRFNSYAGFWTDFIMRDTQEYILEIIKRRCEGEALTPSGNPRSPG